MIVHDDAGPRNHNARTEEVVDRLGDGHHIAVLVHDRKAGRRTRFVFRRITGLHRLHRLFHVDRGGQCASVGLVGQAGERHFHEVGISHVLGTVSKHQFHRFTPQVQRCRRAVAQLGDIEVLKDIEQLNHMRPARTGRRGREDGVAAIRAGNRLAHFRLIAGKVSLSQDTAGGLGCGDDLLCQFAFIEAIFAALGNEFKRFCQIGILDRIANFVRQATLGINLCSGREFVDLGQFVGDDLGQIDTDRNTLVRPVDRRLHDLRPAQFFRTVFFQTVKQAGDFAGHTGGQTTDHVGRINDFSVGADFVHIGARRRRCAFTEIDDHRFFHIGQFDGHEATTAQAGSIGFEHTEGKCRGNRGINRIAALLENIHPDLRGLRFGGSNRTDRTLGAAPVEIDRGLCMNDANNRRYAKHGYKELL